MIKITTTTKKTTDRLTYLIKEPRGEDDLEGVVEDEHPPQVEGFPVGHDPGAQHLHEVHVGQADCKGGEGRGHEEPVIYPLI